MCLILFAYRSHPEYRLILAANRDEFFARPTEPLAFWPDEPEILAGRDLQAGGTWFGLSADGRFAAVTNFRDPSNTALDALSRGGIPVDYLKSGLSPQEFCLAARNDWHRYNGFNLLAGDGESLVYASNRTGQTQELSPGMYGLSNHLLDTEWPKVRLGKEKLRQMLTDSRSFDPENLFTLLEDTWQPPDSMLPDTGIGTDWEHLLAPLFIRGRDYGTRSSLILIVRQNGEAVCIERTFAHAQGIALETGRKRLELNF
ncbi:MAG: NRDE family protein [Desulfoprunum sp.]|nr:NRDE family protein [Desulfoprunum sp.]